MTEFVLGTVQLGMSYGIANTEGKPDLDKAQIIIATAWQHGIRTFDTARAYGDSERVLNIALHRLGVFDDARIITKLPAVVDPADARAVERAVQQSFDALGTDHIHAILLHKAAACLDEWDSGVGSVLRAHRDAGRIKHLGASFNGPEEARRWWNHPDMDLLQVACSAWDQRMLDHGVLDAARNAGKTCYVRSIYLQGLLTMTPDAVAHRLPMAHAASVCWHDIAHRFNIDPRVLAVRFAAGLDLPLVVGAESADQIAQTVAMANEGSLPQDLVETIARELPPLLNDDILTPSTWP